jgi:hypothetical protein
MRFPSMPAVRWRNFLDECSGPHLVVARLPSQVVESGFQASNTRVTQLMLARLFNNMPLQGRFAISVERSRGETELMCAFEHAADAEAVARVVNAHGVAPYEGWASQRSFDLDGEEERRLAAAAGGRRQSRRRVS